MYIRRLYVLVAMVSGFIALTPVSVHAAQGESIVMSPASNRFHIDAGETVHKTFTIINDGTVDLHFKVYANPYSVSNKTYLPNYDAKPVNADLYTWVTFEKDDWHLNPGESVEIPYTLSVPQDAAPGGHYSVIFAETEVNNQDGGQIQRQKRVGAIQYTTVRGEYVTSGKDIGARIDWLQLGGTIQASLSVDNTGNADFVTETLLKIENIFGSKVYEDKKPYIVLPKTTRDIPLNWENGASIGLYQVTVESLVLGNVTTHKTWVLLMPLWLLLVAPIVIAVLVYLALRSRR